MDQHCPLQSTCGTGHHVAKHCLQYQIKRRPVPAVTVFLFRHFCEFHQENISGVATVFYLSAICWHAIYFLMRGLQTFLPQNSGDFYNLVSFLPSGVQFLKWTFSITYPKQQTLPIVTLYQLKTIWGLQLFFCREASKEPTVCFTTRKNGSSKPPLITG